MRSKLFSPLLRGTGPDWSTNFKWYEDEDPAEISPGQHSRYVIHDRQLYRTVPKTFTTHKGAMVLYTSEDLVLKDKVSEAVHHYHPDKMDISQSHLENLQQNILQFGTKEGEESACLKFTRPSADDVYLDESTRPGALPEVYLEDLKYKTRCFHKSNKNTTAKLRPTERPKSVHYTPSSPSPPLSQPNTRPSTGVEKRRLLRPPSAPPQPMKSVQMRRCEIIRDQMKHIDAANRREKLKYFDFELVSTIPDHFKVKGLGGREPQRRAYSSPVYKTKFHEDMTYVTCQSQSLPLFVVKSQSVDRARRPCNSGRRDSQDYNPVSFEGYHEELNSTGELVLDTKPSTGDSTTAGDASLTTADVIAVQKRIIGPGESVGPEEGGGLAEGSRDDSEVQQSTEVTERSQSSRQIIIDLPDENKKPKESFISEELRHELSKTTNQTDSTNNTATTVEQKSGEEVSSTIEDSSQNIVNNKILTYPSFLSLSSANSKDNNTSAADTQLDRESQESVVDDELKREALQDAKSLITDVLQTKKSKKKRGARDPEKRKTRPKKQAQAVGGSKKPADSENVVGVGASVSDGEFTEKLPPRSLVAIHRENVDSSVSIRNRKKSGQSGSRKRRGVKASPDQHVAWERQPSGELSENEEELYRPPPQTMLLDDEPFEQVSGRKERKKLDRTFRQRSDHDSKTSVSSAFRTDTLEQINPIIMTGEAENLVSSAVPENDELGDEQLKARLRKEDRERELRKLESLEKRIGMEDGTLKRLGEKVEIIEKESMEQKEHELAQRQQEKQVQQARKEEERKAYEEVMRAQEEEYERHLQKMLQQEEERNRQYVEKMVLEEREREAKRKLATFRQNQNMELRQHVRLSKLKQKFSMPYKYSYFPLLKTNYLKIVGSIAAPKKSEAKNKKASLKR